MALLITDMFSAPLFMQLFIIFIYFKYINYIVYLYEVLI